MAYEKAYELIGFVNGAPPSLGATNLNRIDFAINEIDNRVVAMEPKLTQAYNNAGIAMNGMNVIQNLYAKKTEVSESLAELEAEISGNYATKEEVSRTVERLESEFSDTYATRTEVLNVETNLSNFQKLADKTYATKAEVEGISETVTEIATEVSKGKADVILANSSGESIHLTDSTDSKAVEFALLGKVTQNGTPTPSAPIDIEVSGADGSVEVKSLGKNLLPYPYSEATKTYNGITYTVNSDGTVKISGTSTGVSTLFLVHNGSFSYEGGTDIPKGTYTLSANASSDKFLLQFNMYDSNNTLYQLQINGNNHTTFEVTNDVRYVCQIRIGANVTVDDIIRPMLVKGEIPQPYEPYRESTTTITTEGGLAGINGVCDENVKYADGSGKKIQRIGKLNKNNYATMYIGTYGSNSQYHGYLLSIPTDRKPMDMGAVMGTHLSSITRNEHYSGSAIGFAPAYSSYIGICVDIPTAEEVKQWLINNDVEFYYQLAEPIITDLSAEEIAEMEVQTFYPTTNILNDANCGMEVTYKADTKNYIDKVIGARLSALESALINNI